MCFKFWLIHNAKLPFRRLCLYQYTLWQAIFFKNTYFFYHTCQCWALSIFSTWAHLLCENDTLRLYYFCISLIWNWAHLYMFIGIFVFFFFDYTLSKLSLLLDQEVEWLSKTCWIGKSKRNSLNFPVVSENRKKLVLQGVHNKAAGWCVVFATLETQSCLQHEQGTSVLTNYLAHFHNWCLSFLL